METSLNWLCPNFLLLHKKFSCPKFGGAAAPQPPRPVRLGWQTLREKSTSNLFRVSLIKKRSRSRELQTEFEQCF